MPVLHVLQLPRILLGLPALGIHLLDSFDSEEGLFAQFPRLAVDGLVLGCASLVAFEVEVPGDDGYWQHAQADD